MTGSFEEGKRKALVSCGLQPGRSRSEMAGAEGETSQTGGGGAARCRWAPPVRAGKSRRGKAGAAEPEARLATATNSAATAAHSHSAGHWGGHQGSRGNAKTPRRNGGPEGGRSGGGGYDESEGVFHGTVSYMPRRRTVRTSWSGRNWHLSRGRRLPVGQGACSLATSV